MFENRLDWFALQDGKFTALKQDKQGIIRSQVFPGLWLVMPALLRGNMSQVLSVLQQGLNSQEHTEFVQCLMNQ